MKRNNPKTNEPFKYGDTRPDGYIFYNYRSDILLTGFRGERWLSPEIFIKTEQRDRLAKHKKRRLAGKVVRMTKGKILRKEVEFRV